MKDMAAFRGPGLAPGGGLRHRRAQLLLGRAPGGPVGRGEDCGHAGAAAHERAHGHGAGLRHLQVQRLRRREALHGGLLRPGESD